MRTLHYNLFFAFAAVGMPSPPPVSMLASSLCSLLLVLALCPGALGLSGHRHHRHQFGQHPYDGRLRPGPRGETSVAYLKTIAPSSHGSFIEVLPSGDLVLVW